MSSVLVTLFPSADPGGHQKGHQKGFGISEAGKDGRSPEAISVAQGHDRRNQVGGTLRVLGCGRAESWGSKSFI